MGIQFIWINSLCIFHDSTLDWQREAPLMSDVYGSATLNIAANAAAGHGITCFPKRDARLIHPCIIESTRHGCENSVYNLYYSDFRDALMKRAWVIQELLLAPRLLHLTGSQLFWECYELSACETYPNGFPPSIREQWMTRDVLWSAFKSSRSSSDRRDSMKKLWKAIVEDYTAAQLTIATDKLIALSGIAKVMARSLGDKYIADYGRHPLLLTCSGLGHLTDENYALGLVPNMHLHGHGQAEMAKPLCHLSLMGKLNI
ncbi:heterokaryon incompatibility protein-domain-containing protein [Penicillium longicatenatum]|nr:heterokaryon incompatibility protein-domain-containing protein [Penicillium longicatenatum]